MLTVTSMLAGCAVGPVYTPPKLSTPNHFYGQNSVGKQETTIDAQLDVWWEKFGDAQLTHYIAIALDQNLDLAQATARLAQARAGLGASSTPIRQYLWTSRSRLPISRKPFGTSIELIPKF